MKLFTKKLRERLLANGVRRGADHFPAVKFFNPSGAATWLFTELDEDGDQLLASVITASAPRSWAIPASRISPRSGSGSDSASNATCISGPTAARSRSTPKPPGAPDASSNSAPDSTPPPGTARPPPPERLPY